MATENIYQKGQIYTIRSHQTNLIYVGSTIQPLSKRFHQHKKTNNESLSREIMIYADAYIELLEDYPCNSKKELNKREGYLIRQMDCVNKQIAGRTPQEWREEHKTDIAAYNKQYRADNKTELNAYRANRKEQISAYQKQYNAEHKTEIAAHKKQYYAANKEQKAAYYKQYYAAKKLLTQNNLETA